MNQLHNTERPPHVEMLELATGHFRSQAILVAAGLGIPDLLKDGPRTSEDLAQAAGVDPRALYRLLRALASLGVFAEDEQGAFHLTALGDTLRSDTPNSVRAAALLAAAPFHWDSWSALRGSIATGGCAFEQVHGMELFDYLRRHAEDAAVYYGWMARLSGMQIPALVEAYDFSPFPVVVDVGGGHGLLLAAILKANPAVRGILFDLPEVIAAASIRHETAIQDRCSLVAGNMFVSVVPDGALYVLKTVIHDWSDDLAQRILANCRRAMTPGSRLLLIESVVPPGNQPHPSKFMDLNMLVLTHGGRERTEKEYKSLFEIAGFQLARVIPTPSPMSLLEGIPEP